MTTFSVLLSGVGGQGLVLLSNIIGEAGAIAGKKVVTGEQHGLSQRSGSISIHLKVGENIRAPLIPIGSGDAILSLEAMEALRYIEYLKDGGVVVMNRRIMRPVTETGEMVKDKNRKHMELEDIETRLKQVTPHIMVLDALELAKDAGNPLTENVVKLGALSVLEAFPLGPEELKAAIGKLVPPKARDANIKAFELGMKAAHERFCKDLACKGIPK